MVKLAVLCPITHHVKGYPFEVIIPAGLQVTGVMLADQIKNLDWRARKSELICKLPEQVTTEVLQKFNTLIRI